jgi:hypothetical protein
MVHRSKRERGGEREKERGRDRKRERERKREGVRKRGRERDEEYVQNCYFYFFKEMTGALAPFSYLV